MSGEMTCVLVLLVVAVSAFPGPQEGATGTSSSKITFGSGEWGGTRTRGVQAAETSALSEQTSTGSGGQENEGRGSAVSVQSQEGLGGSLQVTNNAALVNATQQAAAAANQTSNVQVEINSSQLQQNVNGTLVHVESGHEGVVVVNTHDTNTGELLVHELNNRPLGRQSVNSSRCKYTCRRHGELYCCDDGTNRGTDNQPDIHGGYCPEVRLICPQGDFNTECGHDGQCAASDRCCFDACANRHICKQAVSKPTAAPQHV